MPSTFSRRHGSRILFWYVLREFVLPLGCCLIAFSALFLLNTVFDDLSDFLRRPAGTNPGSLWQIPLYFLLLQPGNMLNILPMSVLLASCFTTSMMGKHQELTAIRGAGIPLTRMALPIWITATLVSIASFWIAEDVVPACSLKAARIFSLWCDTNAYRRRRAKLAYHNAEASRDWFFEEFNPDGVHRGVFIKQFDPDGGILWELQAEQARFKHHTWIFTDCKILPFDRKTQLPLATGRRCQASYSDPSLKETPEQIFNHVRPVEELSVKGIRAIMAANPNLPGKTRAAFVSTLWYRFTFPFASLIGALLGVSLAISKERSSALRGFAYAVGFMVLYYTVGQLGLLLSRNGHLPGIVGGAGPSLGFFLWGVFSMHRKR